MDLCLRIRMASDGDVMSVKSNLSKIILITKYRDSSLNIRYSEEGYIDDTYVDTRFRRLQFL